MITLKQDMQYIHHNYFTPVVKPNLKGIGGIKSGTPGYNNLRVLLGPPSTYLKNGIHNSS